MRASGGLVCQGVIDGTNGNNGYNQAVVKIFRRSSSVLGNSDRPTGTLTYTFATGKLSGASSSYFNGWSQNIPDYVAGTKLYVSMAVAHSQESTDTIAASDWSTPVEYVADGTNSAPITIYKRSASQPADSDKPADGAIYTFATGILTGTLNGWSTDIPAVNNQHDPCWMRHAMAVNTAATDVIGASEWSDPATKVLEDGNGIALVLVRNTYNESGWGSRKSIGATASYAKVDDDPDLTTCRVGDFFMVTGVSTDAGLNHTIIYKCTAVNANHIAGACVSHTQDGSTPWIADLNNEMDSIACDLNGHPTSVQSVSTKVSLFYGATAKGFGKPVVYRNGVLYTVDDLTYSNGVRVLYTSSSNTIIIDYNSDATISSVDKFTITITSTDDNTVVKSLVFSVNGARPGANGQHATLYNLVPTVSEIVLKKDGTFSPTHVGCYCTSLTNGTATDNPSEATVQWSYTGADSSWTNIGPTGSIPSSNINNNGGRLHLRLLVNSKVMDKETIPVVSEGADGDDGLTSNPNMLFRTLFRSISKIKEKWNGAAIDLFNTSYTPTPTSELIEGHNIVRMEQSNTNEFDMMQNVGLEGGKWYTLSFYLRQGTFNSYSGRLKVFLSFGDTKEGCIAEHYLDGVEQSYANDGYTLITGSGWTAVRHVIKFKTVSNMSGVNPGRIYFRFCGGYNIISMPKLEAGEEATPYVANDDDLVGDNAPYELVDYRRYNSRETNTYGEPSGSTDMGSWETTAPATTASYPYIWERIRSYNKDGVLQSTSYVCMTGATGAPGNTGRMYYIAGTYSASKTYVRTSALCPVVYYGSSWWYLDRDESQGNTPSYSSSYWVAFEGLQVVLTEAIFVKEFAQFGSAIITGDWLISLHGKINGGNYGGTVTNPDTNNGIAAYTYFDKSYPNSDRTILSSATSTTSTSYVSKASFYINSAAVEFKVACRVSGGTMTVGLYRGSTLVQEKTVTSTSTTNIYVYDTEATSEQYSIRIKMSSSSNTGTIESITQIPFIPNYAVDLKTGKSYQNDAYVKGQIVATNINVQAGVITGDLAIGSGNVNIKLMPSGSGSSVGAGIKAYDGSLVPFSLTFDRYSFNGNYAPHATLKLESVYPYSSQCGSITITDRSTERVLYYGSSQIPDYTYRRFEGYESITNFSGMVQKLSVNNAYFFRIGITNTGIACLIATAWPTSSDKANLPTGCVYRDGENLKVKI